MAKLSLTDIASGHQSITVYNTNNDAIEAAIDNTLSLDGTTPNAMGADIDMNSNRVTNLADGVNNQDAVTVAQLNGAALGTAVVNAGIIDSEAATDGYVLTADGAGNSAWEAVASSGLANVVEDTTPQLGGDLDMNGNNITAAGPTTISPTELSYLDGVTSNIQTQLNAKGTGTLSNIVEDTTPQLGGILDTNNMDIEFRGSGPSYAYWYNSAGTNSMSIYHGGTEVNFSASVNTTSYNFLNGKQLTLYDSTNADYMRFDVDGTDANLTLNGCAEFNWVSAVPLNMGDNVIQRPKIKDFGITSNSLTVSANAVSVDLSTGNAFEIDLEAATGTVTITLSNPPASGTYGECVLKIQQDTTASRTITWAGGTFRWPGGTVPTMTAAADSIDIFVFKTWDGGTTWYGNAAQAYA